MDWEHKLQQQYAIAVRPEWLEKLLAQLHTAHPDFASWPEAQAFEKIFTAFLFTDLNQAGAAALPANTKGMHKEILKGKFVLQVDEVVNMAAAARERYTNQAAGRCLKLALTDGCQQIVGVEHCHLPAITWDCPAGSKLLVHNVPMRRGLLLLGPDNTALLGGQVERLEAARQQAVASWTRPVVGRPAGSAERDIFAEARLAAWAPGPPAGRQQAQQQPGARAGPVAGAGVGPPAGRMGEAAGAAGGAAPGVQTANGLAAGSGPNAAAPSAHHHQQGQPWQQQQPAQPHNLGGPGGVSSATPAAAQAAAQAPAAAPGWAGPASAHAQQQQWLQQQQQPTQPRGPTPPTQAAASAGNHMAAATPQEGGAWLGRSTNTGAGADDRDLATRLATRQNASRAGGISVESAGGSGPGHGGGGGRSGEPGASHACPVELITSSDSASGGSSHSSLDGSIPVGAPHLVQQHQQPRRQLPPSLGAARLGSTGAALLGGSTCAPGAALPPAAPSPAAAVTGPSTSSSGLLPPRLAGAQRSSAISPTAAPSTAATTGAAAGTSLRKPALPLARSSPGPARLLGNSGKGVGRPIALSPGAATIGTGPGELGAAPEPEMRPARQAVGGRGSSAGRSAAALAEVEMVDLASVDDDGEAYQGGIAAGPGPQAAAAQLLSQPLDAWRRAHGSKTKLQPPLNPAGRMEKRPRLSPLRTEDGGSAGNFEGGLNLGWLGADAQVEGDDEALVPVMQMDLDAADVPAGVTIATANDDNQRGARQLNRHGLDAGGADKLAPHEDPMALETGAGEVDEGNGPPVRWPISPLAAGAVNAYAGTPSNYVGVVLLCHVPDLLAEPEPEPGGITFPVTMDVYGLFHELDGDTAFIEDGSAMVKAQLTDRALAPLLAGAAPPGVSADRAPVGLEEIQAMADSPDPAVQAFGQELATRIMEFIRDFSGVICLEYRGPPPMQPFIVRLLNDSGADGGVGDWEAAAGAAGPSAGFRGSGFGGCEMYERYLRELGMPGLGTNQDTGMGD